MIGNFKYKSIEKQYNKLKEKNIVSNNKGGKVKSVAVILDNASLENVITSNLASKLNFDKKNITFLVYRNFSKKDEEVPKFFTEKEIGFNASLKSDNLKNFVKNDYDLLINYTKSSNLYTNVITLHSQAKLKAGFAGIDDKLFDIVVSDATFNEAVLNQELKKYLTILNKI
ncbi:hypothetical protein SAMN04489761_1270 [Tenacibaculum sp. MAR_2009_124]|uniref:DUF6913 domain-containing protein n=1 Tax=Tenacibaculum sp. MAR_2009_124 TaxID=1250059 RepID=UPI00089C275F|nr:hypothetical protein [Tenacibaculum sp. MAR_2009_124]SEB53640.1 hypothetical protein SAMN04489761_1270 [Tenacibaculum sp. MAR_2009_124]